jgi:hypothetical protein
MKYSEAKKNAAASIESARAEYLEKLLKSEAFQSLKKKIEAFENDPDKYGSLHLTEDGSLASTKTLNLDRELCTDEDGNGDVLLASDLLEEISNDGAIFFHQDDYSSGYFEWSATINFGDPATVNASPYRGQYAVYCSDLGLKVDRINSEEHGLALVEKAMRKHGYFPDVVFADYHGNVHRLTIPEEIRNASDSELEVILERLSDDECA